MCVCVCVKNLLFEGISIFKQNLTFKNRIFRPI
jgi:hypothetical protein